ncbi:hemin ABC transporter substrate-binding protein [Pigmentiphaga soli]|uniref:Hemin ABC transporter substrate-binding protein n=1 Tax=Pigmentiphaga soli TaxID=1007095 RepID=A0ABP8HK41_9BURK
MRSHRAKAGLRAGHGRRATAAPPAVLRRAALAVALAAAAPALPAAAAERLAVLSSDVAEIVVALGKAGEVVARDRSSTMPELAGAADIGTSRAIAAEPVLRTRPTLALGTDIVQPPTVFGQLEKLGVHAVKLGGKADGSDFAEVVREVGRLIGAPDAADRLAADWTRRMTPAAPSNVRVLVTYEGKTMAGRDTPADTLIRAAGAVNAAAGIDGYKQVNPEALVGMAPDVILVAEHNRSVYGGLDRLKARADVAATPAGRSGKVFEMPVHQIFTVNLGSPAAVQALEEKFR